MNRTNIDVTVVSPIMVKTNFFEHPSFENMPQYSPTSLNAKTVAKAIVKASNSPRLEIIVPSFVRIAVWVKHTFPYLINPILGSSFRKQLDSTKKKIDYSSESSEDSLEPSSINSKLFNSN